MTTEIQQVALRGRHFRSIKLIYVVGIGSGAGFCQHLQYFIISIVFLIIVNIKFPNNMYTFLIRLNFRELAR